MAEISGWKVEARRGPRPMPAGTEVMDGWKVVRPLGEGGFGSVYEVEKSVFGVTKSSAFKIVHIPQPRDMEAVENAEVRFQRVERAVREIELMVQMSSNPHVVRVEDYGVVEYRDEGVWEIHIRMEKLTCLQSVWEKQGLTLREICEMGRQMADLLQACWERRIIHRDIKPANIFVDADGNYKMGDFGIARVVEGSAASTIAGTFGFMAPEVLLGMPYDTRADIYSLGLTVYCMIAGGFPAGWSFGQPLPDIPGLPPALTDILRKAAAVNPGDRYACGAEFSEALAALQTDPPVSPVRRPAAASPVTTASPRFSQTVRTPQLPVDRVGYSQDQVMAFLLRLAAMADSGLDTAALREMIETSAFDEVTLGYDSQAVDAFLDELLAMLETPGSGAGSPSGTALSGTLGRHSTGRM